MPRLHKAVFDNKLDEVKQFVEAGDDINEVNKTYTPLLIASVHGHATICEYLLSKGADVSFKRHTGTTCLMLASRFGHVNVCQILLEHGARVDTTNNHGKTALIFAVNGDNIDVVRLLLEKGTAKTMPGYTLYVEEKRQSIKDNSVGIRNETELMGLVAYEWKNLDDDVRASYTTRANAIPIATTAIRVASKKGYVDIVRLLIENGANVNIGRPLAVAAEKGYTDICKLLIDKGADSSPEYISSAYDNGHIQTCLVLIGDDPDALINAALNGWVDICVELRRRGMGGTWDAFKFRRFSDDVLNALNTQPTKKIVIEVKDMIALDSINASADEKDNSPPCIIDGKEQWVMRLDTIISYVRSGSNSPYGEPIHSVALLSNADITRINQDREQQRIEEEKYASERRVQENKAYQEALRKLKEKQALERERLRREMNPHESAYQDTLNARQVRPRSLHVQIQSLRF